MVEEQKPNKKGENHKDEEGDEVCSILLRVLFVCDVVHPLVVVGVVGHACPALIKN
jgi:hypothetical protein